MPSPTAINCPDCGVLLEKRKLASHQGGEVCRVRQKQTELAAAGYIPINSSWQMILSAARVRTLREGVTTERYQEFGPTVGSHRNTPARTYLTEDAHLGLYAPEWVVPLLKFTSAAPKELRIEALRWASSRPEARAAVAAAGLLGGSRELVARLAAAMQEPGATAAAHRAGTLLARMLRPGSERRIPDDREGSE